ncbi:hypothetical protein LIA77_00387 [Sarocladium implicatum]|nr:hypothetical protein LIA77_00387 [Sarocladium implicatum]
MAVGGLVRRSLRDAWTPVWGPTGLGRRNGKSKGCDIGRSTRRNEPTLVRWYQKLGLGRLPGPSTRARMDVAVHLEAEQVRAVTSRNVSRQSYCKIGTCISSMEADSMCDRAISNCQNCNIHIRLARTGWQASLSFDAFSVVD